MMKKIAMLGMWMASVQMVLAIPVKKSRPTDNNTSGLVAMKKRSDAYWKSITDGIAFIDYLPLTGGTLSGQLDLNYPGARMIYQSGTDLMATGLWDGVNARIESSNRPLLLTTYTGTVNLGISGGTTMSIGSSNVGIGTTTPANLLEVQKDQDAGTFMVVRNAASSTSAYTGIRASSQNQNMSIMANSDGFSRPYPGFHTSSVTILGDAANGLNIISDAAGSTPGPNAGMIRFITYASPGGVTTNATGNDALTRMVIDGNGKIGIGTITPSEKLSVAGNIRTQKVIVTQLGWSDYVFDQDYKIRPLAEVEQYVKINKHLPDIPSAKEVEQNGIDLGDSQALLLKKIEELTLYMIELKKETGQAAQLLMKENQQLKQRVRELEHKIVAH